MPAKEANENIPNLTEAMGPFSFLLAQHWWMLALRGIFAIFFGIIAFIWPGVTLLSLVLIFAAYRLVDGIFGLATAIHARRRDHRSGSLIFLSLCDIAIGVLAALWPDITILAFVLLVAAWSILSGGWMIYVAARLDHMPGRGWLGFGGLASLIFGALLVLAPLIGALVLAWWIGAYALIVGVSLLVLAFHVKPKGRGPSSQDVPRPI